jgi:uncharacterized membrane protein
MYRNSVFLFFPWIFILMLALETIPKLNKFNIVNSGIYVGIVPSSPICLTGYSLYMLMDGFCLLEQKRAILIWYVLMWSNKALNIDGFILKYSEVRSQFFVLQERQIPGLKCLVDVRHLTALGLLCKGLFRNKTSFLTSYLKEF